MLDLVKQETERIESRPRAGMRDGTSWSRFSGANLRCRCTHRRSQLEWERNAVWRVFGLWDRTAEDNAQTCRERLFSLFDTMYARRYKDKTRDQCRDSIRYLLGRNIIWGSALTLQTVGPDPQPIVFSGRR